MKTKRYNIQITAMVGLIGMMALQAAAGSFNYGSDGSYGAMNITQNTVLNVPSNGVFNCTTITVGCNVQLNFIPNALNTPVYLLATGDVNIIGRLVVSGNGSSGGLGGAGGPGGFAGGTGGISGGHNQAGDGQGPGGGKDANNWYGGVYAYSFNSNTNV
ncbi:MAG TPA: hypothetical protein VFC07_11695, partial [Verrucomicrobiae bacterium]|nr:hypothetical protein [Verrucomicrobiae bacterium]